MASGLKRLGDQVRQAQQTAGRRAERVKRGQDSGTQSAALDHVDRLAESASEPEVGAQSGFRADRDQ